MDHAASRSPLRHLRGRRLGRISVARPLRSVEPPKSSKPVRDEFRRDVEGLRAVAILLVVLYHCKTGISGGYVGVDVFFVISGFLITSQLVRELQTKGTISFRGFYARRARRILPAATLATVSTVVASGLVLSPLAAMRTFSDAQAAALFAANYHFAAQGADYFNAGAAPSPIQHYWSLSVEEQFYIVWPLLLTVSSLVWLAARRRAPGPVPQRGDGSSVRPSARPVMRTVVVVLAGVAALSFVASVRQTPTSPSSAYYSILTRAWELAAGALVALALSGTRRLASRVAVPITWIGVACIAAAALMFSDSTPFPGTAALLPVAGAAAIIAAGSAVTSRWGAEALLGTAPFQRIGSWSYSWYLWHWPVLVLAPVLLGHALSELEALVMAAISLVLAVLSFVLVERPVRHMQLIVRRPTLGLAIGASLIATSLAVIALSGPVLAPLQAGKAVAEPALGQSHRLTAAQLAIDLRRGVSTRKVPSNLRPPLRTAADAKPMIVKNGCHLQYVETRSKPCIYGDTKSRTSVVLFGDSHAATWFPALDIIAKQQHWRLIDLSKAACPPPEVNIFWDHRIYSECPKWRTYAEREIASLHPKLVIVAWARYLSGLARPLPGVPGHRSTWQNGTAAIFSFLRRAAQQVIFISDVPTLQQWAPECVSAHMSDVRKCTTKRRDAIVLPAVRAQEFALAQQAHISTIDPLSWFCAPTTCPVIVGNIILYRDDAHMVPQWSDFITPVLSDAILRMAPSAPASATKKN